MQEIVRLRGHHILCLLGFRGLGYSPEFVENMTRVHSRVFSESCTIEIVAGADDICGACPRLEDCGCGKESCSNVGRRDQAVLSLLAVHPGESLNSVELYRKVMRRIGPDEMSDICHRCQWMPLGYCADGLARLLSEMPIEK